MLKATRKELIAVLLLVMVVFSYKHDLQTVASQAYTDGVEEARYACEQGLIP